MTTRNYSRPPFRPPLRLAQLHQDRGATRRRDAGAVLETGVSPDLSVRVLWCCDAGGGGGVGRLV